MLEVDPPEAFERGETRIASVSRFCLLLGRETLAAPIPSRTVSGENHVELRETALYTGRIEVEAMQGLLCLAFWWAARMRQREGVPRARLITASGERNAPCVFAINVGIHHRIIGRGGQKVWTSWHTGLVASSYGVAFFHWPCGARLARPSTFQVYDLDAVPLLRWSGSRLVDCWKSVFRVIPGHLSIRPAAFLDFRLLHSPRNGGIMRFKRPLPTSVDQNPPFAAALHNHILVIAHVTSPFPNGWLTTGVPPSCKALVGLGVTPCCSPRVNGNRTRSGIATCIPVPVSPHHSVACGQSTYVAIAVEAVVQASVDWL